MIEDVDPRRPTPTAADSSSYLSPSSSLRPFHPSLRYLKLGRSWSGLPRCRGIVIYCYMRRIVETCLRMAPLWMMSPSMGALVATRGASSLALPPPSSFARLECHARRRRRRRWDGGESFYSYAPSSSGGDDATSGGDNDDIPSPRHKIVHVPLVFVPGMKGTHLAFDDGRGTVGDAGDDGRRSGRRRERVWLTLGNLLHIPPRPDDDPSRDLSLPLTYDHDASPDVGEGDGHVHRASLHPRQHRGKLVPDGIVDHIIEFNVGGDMDGGTTYNFVDLNFLPFYGHVVRPLLNRAHKICVYNIYIRIIGRLNSPVFGSSTD